MGLWLKCPKCQASNPLSQKACASCGASLENLPEKERIYVLTPTGAPPPEPAAPAKPAKPEAKPAKKAVKPEAAKPVSRAWESEGPPPKKAKGPKAVRKKKEK